MTHLRLETFSMPSCNFGGENPLPPLVARRNASTYSLPTYAGENDVHVTPEDQLSLPYLLQDQYDRALTPKNFKVAVLENDFLRVTFLLDLGGRMWSLFDKTQNRELLFKNPVFRPANLACRDAWFSGGVEWNISLIAHSPSTCTPSSPHASTPPMAPPSSASTSGTASAASPGKSISTSPKNPTSSSSARESSTPGTATFPCTGGPTSPSMNAKTSASSAPLTTPAATVTTVASSPTPSPSTKTSTSLTPPNAPTPATSTSTSPRNAAPGPPLSTPKATASSTPPPTASAEEKSSTGATPPADATGRNSSPSPVKPTSNSRAGSAPPRANTSACPPTLHGIGSKPTAPSKPTPPKPTAPTGITPSTNSNPNSKKTSPAPPPKKPINKRKTSPTRPPAEILHTGSGWGALERRRREKAGQPAQSSAALPFPDSSLTPEQKPWLELLETGALPQRSPADIPLSPIIQREWRDLLEASLKTSKGDHWLSWYQVGIMRYGAGDHEGARQAWQTSIQRAPSAWAYRNLAVLTTSDQDNSASADLLAQAWKLQPSLQPLTIEYARALSVANQPRQTLAFIDALPDHFRTLPRLRLIHAQSSLALNDFPAVADFFAHPIDIANMREQEVSLSDLWFDYHEKRALAAANNHPLDESAKSLLRQQNPPPQWLDFRLRITDKKD